MIDPHAGRHGVPAVVPRLGGGRRVIGGVLVRLGEEPDRVASWLDGVHRFRGRDGWGCGHRDVLDEMAVR